MPGGWDAPITEAHPRSRGENFRRRRTRRGRPGSSPLTRGKRNVPRGEVQSLGLIPAHAGKTALDTDPGLRAGAHPRSRGENGTRVSLELLSWGSSPLTRGKRGSRDHRPDARGLIPAHAGKTSMVSARPPPSGAHPRSRGENHEGTEIVGFIVGSSPLTRGKLLCRLLALRRHGLIPAHAGKTKGRRLSGRGMGAHPRSRGENTAAGLPAAGVGGSSPLTRGKPPRRSPPKSRPGLIPAHAGKTRTAQGRPSSAGAHPRSRGENPIEPLNEEAEAGSSPLTRGKHFLTCAFIAQIGQILESLELCASSESYSLRDAYATDALRDQVRSIGLVPLSSRGAS